MELKIKRLNDKAIMPIRAYKGDAGLDLTAIDISLEQNECGQTVVVYHCGLAVEIPEGYVGLIFPRSSISKKSMFITNAVGVIDSGYRGEITAKMHVTTDARPAMYTIGERFAQLVIMPLIDFNVTEVAELSESERGDGGYGSSDTKLSAPDASEGSIQDVDANNNEATTVAADSTEESEVAE